MIKYIHNRLVIHTIHVCIFLQILKFFTLHNYKYSLVDLNALLYVLILRVFTITC